MTQEEKELLLKYLCMALPYGVICQVDDGAAGFNDGKLVEIDVSEELVRFGVEYWWRADIEYVKPYLRPMSSMTEEEEKDFHAQIHKAKPYSDGKSYNIYEVIGLIIDWLLKNHFDFIGLIHQGLAIEVTESNNPYEI